MDQLKICRKCGQKKKTKDFYFFRNGKPFDKCKECKKSYQRIAGLLYRHTQRGKEVMRKAMKKYYATGKWRTSHKRYRMSDKGKKTERLFYIRYRQTERGREVNRRSVTKYSRSQKGKLVERLRKLKWPEKISARKFVQERISQGNFPKAFDMKCHNCNDMADQYHHYLGYERKHRLDVIPLCRPCHNRTHHQTPKELHLVGPAPNETL